MEGTEVVAVLEREYVQEDVVPPLNERVEIRIDHVRALLPIP